METAIGQEALAEPVRMENGGGAVPQKLQHREPRAILGMNDLVGRRTMEAAPQGGADGVPEIAAATRPIAAAWAARAHRPAAAAQRAAGTPPNTRRAVGGAGGPEPVEKHEPSQHGAKHRPDDVSGLQPADASSKPREIVCTARCRWPKLTPIISVGNPNNPIGSTM